MSINPGQTILPLTSIISKSLGIEISSNFPALLIIDFSIKITPS
ncbi:unnamed protein product [marine sediment metagenome]|uniref:Uncharacterized protein n=1 Tax=marine sediment metagenome TaxID=412755 RepID=X0YQH9_9ZZZZ